MTNSEHPGNIENCNSLQNKKMTPDRKNWRCNSLTACRRRLIEVIKDIEERGPNKTSAAQVQYYRMLIYAYQTLASVVKDSELDKLTSRLDVLEKRVPNEA
jgi:NAD-dependent DNA ligase